MRFVFFLSCALGFTACTREPVNGVAIDFLEPAQGETIAAGDADDVLILVRFTAGVRNHEQQVRLYREAAPADLLVDWISEAADTVVHAEFHRDLSGFDPGSEFTLEAEACLDGACEQVARSSIRFFVE